jgi:hypothetical protein
MSHQVARRAVGYVDGFNLYHGMHSRFGRKWLWLDVEALVLNLSLTSDELTLVRYFTAGIRDDRAGAARQTRYLNGLMAHCTCLKIHLGRYQARQRRCRFCGETWQSYEEKETDVSIAVRLVADANADRFDTAVIVSADGDLVPAIQEIRRVRPSATVVVAFPPGRSSDRLRKVAGSRLRINESMLRRSQLPKEIVAPNGVRLTKPAYWTPGKDGVGSRSRGP